MISGAFVRDHPDQYVSCGDRIPAHGDHSDDRHTGHGGHRRSTILVAQVHVCDRRVFGRVLLRARRPADLAAGNPALSIDDLDHDLASVHSTCCRCPLPAVVVSLLGTMLWCLAFGVVLLRWAPRRSPGTAVESLDDTRAEIAGWSDRLNEPTAAGDSPRPVPPPNRVRHHQMEVGSRRSEDRSGRGSTR